MLDDTPMKTPLTKKDLLDLLKEMIVGQDNCRLGIENYDITPESTLRDLGFDSLDVVELSMNIERKLDIRIEDEEVEKILLCENIEKITDFLYTRTKNLPS